MYPILRMAKGMALAGLAPPLPLTGTHVSHHICWPWDLDMWLELNNGRSLTLYDLGRIPLAIRTGLAGALRRNRWGLTMAGASVRWRRRVRVFDRVEVHSRCIGWDARFLYLEQSMWKGGEAASAALFRSAVTGPRGIVPPEKVLDALGMAGATCDLPDYAKAWIALEETRPGPRAARPEQRNRARRAYQVDARPLRRQPEKITMHRRDFLNRVGFGALCASGLALAGCVPAEPGYAYDPGYGQDPYYFYDYYPSFNVYYHPATRYYYYVDGGRWRRVRNLPPRYRLGQRERRRIYHHGDRPFERNRNHRRGDWRDWRGDGRDDRGDRRNDRRDDRGDGRGDRRDDRGDRRDDRPDRRGDRGDGRQDNRRDGRQDRQEDRRQDRRQGRGDDRPERTAPPPEPSGPVPNYRIGGPGGDSGVR